MRNCTPRALWGSLRRAAKPASVTTLALGLVCQSLLLLASAPSVAAQKKITTKLAGPEVKDVDAPSQAPVRVGGPVGVVGQPKQKTPVAPQQPEPFAPRRLTPAVSVTVNMKELSRRQARAPLAEGPPILQAAPAPMTIREPDAPAAGGPGGDDIAPPAPAAQADDPGGPNVPSPAPSQNFLGVEDGPLVGTTSFTIPPDTMGAVGLDKVFTNLNNNYRVHDKATGAPLSTVSINTFWAATGATGVFDPRVQYDQYNNRWLVSAVAGAQTPTSSVLIGISDTADPEGTYHLYRFIVGCAAGGISPITGAACNANGEWADFPMIGYSKGWYSVTWNHFTITTGAFIAGRGIFVDYPQLRTGPTAAALTTFTINGLDFCAHPASTYDANLINNYFVAHLSSGGATYRVFTLSGNPPSLGGTVPSVTVTGTLTRPGGGWTQPGGDIAPQTCVGVVGTTCPTTLRGIDSGDAFVRSNVVYRNGNLYYPQTVSLPAGTAAANNAARLAAQWTVINAVTGAFVDGGRVEDPTATKTNGGFHYAYPSIGVNKSGDIMLGFTEFESDDFADAAYSFRLSTDAAGTMRDPVVYKDGEDYYSKAFSGTRNRWGDYSHTMVDPSNDRDLWTLQEYAGTRTVPNNLTTTNNSRWGTWWAKVTAPAGAGDLLISEFRLRGPGGAADEFVELYNNNNTPLTVTTLDGTAGYAVAAEDGVVRCTVPNGTNIPARGHYLCVNSAGYSLAAYPAGSGTTASGDATFTTDIPDNNGVAVFRSATTLDATTRLDSAGFTSTPAGVYLEGTGIPTINPTFNINHAFYRDNCGKQGSITFLGTCPTGGYPRDTNNNAVDFVFVDTNGTSAGAGQRLGAPGPENLSSPIQRNDTVGVVLVDATVAGSNPPNRIRDFTSDPPNNSTFGTLTIRRRVVNNTGVPVTRLRFRVVDITTFPAPSGFADLRTRTSGVTVVNGVNDAATCSPLPAPCVVTVQGTTVEEPPAQPNGGAFNSSYSADTVTLAAPLAPGGSISVQFLLGIQQTGTFKFFINVEALP